jgi:hypothetical protein
MKNRYADADANFPAGSPGFRPGYLAYLDSLGTGRDIPSSLILAEGEPAVLRIVRSCGAVLGPVYHVASPDHTAIRAAVARLEAGSPVIALTGERIFLTTVGGHGGCPLCGAFGSAGAAGCFIGGCPVLASQAPASAALLTGAVLAALHVLIDDVCDRAGEPDAHVARGYSINLLAVTAHLPRSRRGRVELAGVITHRGHA